MISTSTHRRGDLPKRMYRPPFRSVLSMDVEYKGAMPNLKISGRNTIQATGCQNMEVLSQILGYLVQTSLGGPKNPGGCQRRTKIVGSTQPPPEASPPS